MKGYVYIMTTAVDGIIKIGRSDNWKQRCQALKENGYKNLNGLDTFFVVEVNDSNEIESMMHDIFHEGCVVNSKGTPTKLFACDKYRAARVLKQVGKVVFENGEEVKDKLTKTIANQPATTKPKKKASTTFEMLNIPVGSELTFINDDNIKIKTVENNKVEYEGHITSISEAAWYYLGQKYFNSGQPRRYCGPAYFKYNGKLLSDLRLALDNKKGDI